MIRKGQCLPLAIGNVHGAIAAGHKYQKKVEARLNLDRLEELNWVTYIPLVMHGGIGHQAGQRARNDEVRHRQDQRGDGDSSTV